MLYDVLNYATVYLKPSVLHSITHIPQNVSLENYFYFSYKVSTVYANTFL